MCNHHNVIEKLLLVAFQFLFGLLRYDQATAPIIYNCHKKSVSHKKLLCDQEMGHSNFADIASNALQNVELPRKCLPLLRSVCVEFAFL